MKYLEQYIEEKLKLKVLGQLTTRESNSGEEVGVSLVIDGYEPGIEVWYTDYAKWLEEKIASGGLADGENKVSSEKMVPVLDVMDWLDRNFYVRYTKRLNDVGEIIYDGDEVISDFGDKNEMIEWFLKDIKE